MSRRTLPIGKCELNTPILNIFFKSVKVDYRFYFRINRARMKMLQYIR